MKRKASTITSRSSKKPRRVATKIETVPTDLLTEVFARVASASFTDIFNAKLSCKIFHEVAEDTYVYRHVSLDNFPIVAWNPLTEKHQSFLKTCEKSQNPEIMYRKAVVGYFSGTRLEPKVTEYLERALKFNHLGAMYLTCIVLLFSGDEETRNIGVKWLANIKKCKILRRKLKFHREKLANMLRMLWVNNSDLRQYPIFCTREDNHRRKRGWVAYELDEDVICEACSVDDEIRFLYDIFPRW